MKRASQIPSKSYVRDDMSDISAFSRALIFLLDLLVAGTCQVNLKMKREQERINTETIDYIAKFVVTVKSGRKGNFKL